MADGQYGTIKLLLKGLSAVGFVFGAIALVYGIILNLQPWRSNLSTMVTVHATQYHDTAAGLADDKATTFWAMFLPTQTENPSSLKSHVRSVAYMDLCSRCAGDKKDSCNPVFGKADGQLTTFNDCMSAASSVDNALKCNAETLHTDIIENNERTSLGFTGSARAQTLYATVLVGIGFTLIYTNIDVLAVMFMEESDKTPRNILLFKQIVFYGTALFFIIFTVTRKMGTEKLDSVPNVEIHWNDIDNTDIYCLLFLLLLVATLAMRKTNIFEYASDIKKKEDGTLVSESLPDIDPNSSSGGRSAFDIGVIFAFQFLVWFSLVQNHRVSLDTVLQKHLLSAAAIGGCVLVSNEVIAVLYTLKGLRTKYSQDDTSDNLISWHAFVVSLASLGIVLALWIFTLSEDTTSSNDGNLLNSLFYLLILIPTILTVVFNALQASSMTKYKLENFMALIDLWKLVFLIFIIISYFFLVETDLENKDLLHKLKEHACVATGKCNEAVFEFRAKTWMRDLVTLSTNSLVDKPREYFCEQKLYPAYDCM